MARQHAHVGQRVCHTRRRKVGAALIMAESTPFLMLLFSPTGTSENSFWAREQLSSSGHDRVTAGYAGIQLPSHWSIFPYGYFGSDWGIQAIAAMLAKPFIDYYVGWKRRKWAQPW